MNVTTESGITLVLERTRPETPNANASVGTVLPEAYGGPVMGEWGSNVVPTTPWQGWPVDWDTGWYNGSSGQLGARAGVAATCADLNSRQLASFPIYAMKGETMVDSPSWTVNPEPALYSDISEAIKQLTNSLQLRGEAFLYCTGRYASPNGVTPGQVARWAVLNPDRMQVSYEEGITYRHNGDEIPRSEICHVKHQSFPGNLRGIGPIEWCASSVIGQQALQNYMAGLATRGGVPWAVIKSPMKLNDVQAGDMQQAWVSAAAKRNGAPAVLSGGVELETLTLSPHDMALLDLNIFNAQQICAAFGVPSYLVNLDQPGGLTYSNSQDLRRAHWQSTLRPMAQSIANAISAWALPIGTRLEFNPDRYVQPEQLERAQTYQLLFNIVDPVTGERAMSIPEIRTAERFSPPEPTTTVELSAQMVE